MKNFIKFLLSLLIITPLAIAQDNISQSTGIIGNGRLLGAKTYDGQTTIGILGVNSTANTVIDSLSGKGISLRVGGVDELVVTNDQIAFQGNTNSQIVPGASSFAIRDSTDSQNNFLVNDSGTVTPFLDIVFRSGSTISIQEATAGSKCMGSVSANGLTAVVVSTTCATTGSRIIVSRSSAPSGTAQCWYQTIVNGVSFELDCSGAETGTFDWVIFHEAP